MKIPVRVESERMPCGHYPPPSPDEIDQLLASVAATGYASEAVWIVEDWIEKRYGYPGGFTARCRVEDEQERERRRPVFGQPETGHA